MVIKCQSRHSTLSSLTSEPMHLAITAFFSQKCLGCCSSTIWGRGGNVSFLKKFKTSPLTYITFLPIFWIYVFHSFLWLHLPLRDLALILAGVQIPRTFNWTWLKKKENQLCVNQFSLVNQDWPDTAGRNTYLGRFRREDVPETSMGTSPSHGHLRRKGGRTGVKTCRSSVLCYNGGGPFKGTPQAKSSAHEKKKRNPRNMGNLQEAALRSLHCHPELSHQVHTPESTRPRWTASFFKIVFAYDIIGAPSQFWRVWQYTQVLRKQMTD